MELTAHAQKNREHWDLQSDTYEAQHAAQLQRNPMAWGTWSIPESRLNALGDVSGKDVLELGCGAARWSIALAQRGARVVALDNSEHQLRHARRLLNEAGADLPLVHASAESVPLADASFDVVFCDHGAMTFCDPNRTVPEAARLLRSGGLFAFSHETPLHFLCWDEISDRVDDRLHADYFSMRAADDGKSVCFNLPYGKWIALFRGNGFAIEDLLELQPPESGATTYGDYAPLEWARKWPAEQLWRLRKI